MRVWVGGEMDRDTQGTKYTQKRVTQVHNILFMYIGYKEKLCTGEDTGYKEKLNLGEDTGYREKFYNMRELDTRRNYN